MEELLEFPTTFAFKIVGPHREEFVEAAAAVPHGVLGEAREVRQRARISRQGTYVSVTLTTRIEDVDELHAVYAGLRRVPGVITVL